MSFLVYFRISIFSVEIHLSLLFWVKKKLKKNISLAQKHRPFPKNGGYWSLVSLSRSFTQFELVLGSVITEFQILCKINPREINFSITIFWIFPLRKLNKCPISKKKNPRKWFISRGFFFVDFLKFSDPVLYSVMAIPSLILIE